MTDRFIVPYPKLRLRLSSLHTQVHITPRLASPRLGSRAAEKKSRKREMGRDWRFPALRCSVLRRLSSLTPLPVAHPLRSRCCFQASAARSTPTATDAAPVLAAIPPAAQLLQNTANGLTSHD